MSGIPEDDRESFRDWYERWLLEKHDIRIERYYYEPTMNDSWHGFQYLENNHERLKRFMDGVADYLDEMRAESLLRTPSEREAVRKAIKEGKDG